MEKELKMADYTVVENVRIGANTMLMRLSGPTDCFTAPGQFVNISIPGLTLRRPISVCDLQPGLLTIVYDIVGKGTEAMAHAEIGQKYNILPALGNGFTINPDSVNPVLFGGGVGCPPLYLLAKSLMLKGLRPAVVLGFNDKNRIIMKEMFEALGLPVYIATMDGSEGVKGYVTDAVREAGLEPDYFYACGPAPMMRALCQHYDVPGQVSLEARMACGFGICACCAIKTVNGPKGVCKNGPVFGKEEIIWE